MTIEGIGIDGNALEHTSIILAETDHITCGLKTIQGKDIRTGDRLDREIAPGR